MLLHPRDFLPFHFFEILTFLFFSFDFSILTFYHLISSIVISTFDISYCDFLSWHPALRGCSAFPNEWEQVGSAAAADWPRPGEGKGKRRRWGQRTGVSDFFLEEERRK